MYLLLIILIIVVCLLLVAVVMVQNSKGGGLASDFSSSNQIIGVQRTGDFLEKATWYLTVALIVFTLGSNFFIDRGDNGQPKESTVIEQRDNGTALPGEDLGTDDPTE